MPVPQTLALCTAATLSMILFVMVPMFNSDSLGMFGYRPVVLVSFDGFRHDYVRKEGVEIPNIKR